MTYTLHITPQPTPRPRLGRYGVYNTREYSKYKTDLIFLIIGLHIPKAQYDHLTAMIYIPFPKSTAKKNRIDGQRHHVKPDCDNVAKGLCDALEACDVLKNDSQLFAIQIFKFYTTEEIGRIEFTLA